MIKNDISCNSFKVNNFSRTGYFKTIDASIQKSKLMKAAIQDAGAGAGNGRFRVRSRTPQ